MKIKLLLFFIFFIVSTTVFSQQWYPVGNNDSTDDELSGTNYTNIAISSTGVVYQAFIDEDNGRKGSVRKLDGGHWTFVGTRGFTPGTVGDDIKIMVDTQGALIVYFRDGSRGNRATVMKFTDGEWKTLYFPGFSDGSASDLNMAVNPTNNTPYYSYRDAMTQRFHIRVPKDPYFTYLVKNVDEGKYINDAFYATRLAVSSEGIVHLMYHKDSEGFKIKKFQGNDWQDLAVANVFENTRYSYVNDMIFHGNVMYVAYKDWNNNTYVKKYANSTWTAIGPVAISYADISNIKIIVLNNVPYIAYNDSAEGGYKVYVKKFINNSWENVGTAVSANAASSISLAGNAITGEVYVGYTSGANSFLKVFRNEPLVLLPVSLVSFKASRATNNVVNLSWSTKAEIKNNYFTLLKSKDGNSFNVFGKYAANGNFGNYKAVDRLPYLGTSYYKLQQTDLDGTVTDLGIQTVKVNDLQTKALSVHPNPVKNGVIEISHQGLDGKQQVKIYDLSGKQLTQQELIFTAGKATLTLTDTIKSGLYILKTGNTSTKIQIN